MSELWGTAILEREKPLEKKKSQKYEDKLNYWFFSWAPAHKEKFQTKAIVTTEQLNPFSYWHHTI